MEDTDAAVDALSMQNWLMKGVNDPQRAAESIPQTSALLTPVQDYSSRIKGCLQHWVLGKMQRRDRLVPDWQHSWEQRSMSVAERSRSTLRPMPSLFRCTWVELYVLVVVAVTVCWASFRKDRRLLQAGTRQHQPLLSWHLLNDTKEPCALAVDQMATVKG